MNGLQGMSALIWHMLPECPLGKDITNSFFLWGRSPSAISPYLGQHWVLSLKKKTNLPIDRQKIVSHYYPNFHFGDNHLRFLLTGNCNLL